MHIVISTDHSEGADVEDDDDELMGTCQWSY